jgi:hypothetical protein
MLLIGIPLSANTIPLSANTVKYLERLWERTIKDLDWFGF